MNSQSLQLQFLLAEVVDGLLTLSIQERQDWGEFRGFL